MKDLKGKNAILTGSSKGIGVYIAKALAREGIRLVLAARTVDLLDSVAGEVAKLGVKVIAIPTDVTVEAELHSLVDRTQKELGSIDILINNAGIVQYIKFSNQRPNDIIQIIATDLTAPLLLINKVLPEMLKRGSGHIVNVASMAGKKGIPYEATYAAAKAGLAEYSNALRLELEGTGVGVSAICPVYVTKVGTFAVHGYPAPRLVGSVTPEQVASAVIKVIRRNIGELLVRPTPTRPLLALNSLSPSLGNRIIRAMGVIKLQKKMAGELGLKDINSVN